MFQPDFPNSKAVPARKVLSKRERGELRRTAALRRLWEGFGPDGRAL